MKILHLEDNPLDAELIKSTFDAEGIDCDIVHVEKRDDFIRAIEQACFDLILLDYTIPSFDGPSALQIVKEKHPDVPVIFVSGTIGEERAIEILKKGATDYVLKSKLSLLVPSVNRTLREAQERTERKQAEEALKESEQRFRAIFDNAADGILIADIENKKFHSGNNMICNMLGYTVEEIKELGITDIHPQEDLPYVLEQFRKQSRKEITLATDVPMKRKDGSIFYAEVNSFPITLSGKTYLTGIFRDITDRKQSEEEIHKREEELKKRVEELEDFYDMGIGRELRMIELKKEIESLKQELSKYKKDAGNQIPDSGN